MTKAEIMALWASYTDWRDDERLIEALAESNEKLVAELNYIATSGWNGCSGRDCEKIAVQAIAEHAARMEKLK
jgi:hypothetical protein